MAKSTSPAQTPPLHPSGREEQTSDEESYQLQTQLAVQPEDPRNEQVEREGSRGRTLPFNSGQRRRHTKEGLGRKIPARSQTSALHHPVPPWSPGTAKLKLVPHLGRGSLSSHQLMKTNMDVLS